MRFIEWKPRSTEVKPRFTEVKPRSTEVKWRFIEVKLRSTRYNPLHPFRFPPLGNQFPP